VSKSYWGQCCQWQVGRSVLHCSKTLREVSHGVRRQARSAAEAVSGPLHFRVNKHAGHVSHLVPGIATVGLSQCPGHCVRYLASAERCCTCT